MFLIVGLGNPGKNYENTYHNVGFKVIDELAKQNAITLNKTKGDALIYEGKLFDEKIILAKPQTFMNLSGTSVRKLSQKFKIDAKHILVIFDDVDLTIGSIRFRNEGSAGTHNGMKDIVTNLNGAEFPRIRVGIGQELKKGQDLADYVLSKIDKLGEDRLEPAIKNAITLIEQFIKANGELENKSIS
ncbi:MAG: aminoacyl-tRNA hydrolase [Spirochaetales bacterium]